MRSAISLLFMMSIAATGCKKKEADKAPEPPVGSAAEPAAGSATGAGSGSAAGSATDPAAAAGSAADVPVEGAKMSKRGGNCPSMVAGVTTTASADATAVTVAVTANDADAIASIQKRSEELLEEKADPAAGGEHNQKGTYGGALGLCPVGTNGATAKMEKTAKGVTIVLTPAAGTTVAELKAKVEERIKASAEFVAANIKPATADEGNGGAVGGGKGDHGSNHSGEGNGKGKKGDGKGGSKGTGGGSGAGTGGGTKPDEKTK
jgi:hypothetical protein